MIHKKFAALLLAAAGLVPFLYAQETPPFAFVAIGDTGCDCEGQKKVAELLVEWHQERPFDMVFLLGDNIVGKGFLFFGKDGGHPELFDDRFDRYYRPLQEVGVVFHAVLGNHDIETNNGADEIADKGRFGILNDTGYYRVRAPVVVEGQPLIEFFALNSNALVDGREDPDQVRWLRESLEDSNAIWKVVVAHHPLYSPEGKYKPDENYRRALEQILVENGVAMVLSAHNHFYARMKPVAGVVHFTSGGGGRKLHDPKVNAETACAIKVHHFLYFEVYADRIEFAAVDAAKHVVDRGTLAPGGRHSYHDLPLQCNSEFDRHTH